MLNRIKIKNHLFLLTLFLVSCFLFPSCSDDESITPKPRAYYRISFPEKKYSKYDSVCPFIFEIPNYSKIEFDKNIGAEPCWLNVNYFSFNGTLHLSYEALKNDLDTYLSNTYTLVTKHQIKASGIETEQITNRKNKVYGLVYNIEGNAASPIQFFLTDSAEHFLRGALYFNAVPNIDSIAPAIAYIKKDINRMIETFEWKYDKESTAFAQAVNKK